MEETVVAGSSAASSSSAAVDDTLPHDARRRDASATRAPGASLRPGDLVGRLVILSELGKGGMGVVYAAHDPELDRKVALKMILGDRSRDADARLRLQREAQALAKLAHPNVVTVLDVGEHHGQLWILMEFVQGQTLTAWLKEQAPTWRAVLEVFKPAARGVAAAHAAGLLHRDLKPDNIMVGSDGRVRVMDFGLVRRDGDSETRARAAAASDASTARARADPLTTDLTRHGSLLGTPAYMAPEQYSGEPTDVRTDTFSLCATLWTALYGERPFAGDTIAALHDAVLSGRVRAPSEDAAVPAWLRRAVLRGLAAEPERRYPSVDALLEALAADPTRRRWILGGALGLGLIAGVGYTSDRLAHERALAACEAEGALISARWDEAARVELRSRAEATGVSFAATVIDKTAPMLDAYAEEWRGSRVAVCRAATIERRWDEEVTTLAVGCLAERRAHFETLVDTLRGVGDDAGAVDILEGAVLAAAELPQLAGCRVEHRLRARPHLATTDADYGAVQRLRERLTAADALRAVGRHRESLARVAEVEEEAAAAGLRWPPLQAAALYQRGVTLEATGEHARAERALTDAYLTAGAAGADELAINAATALITVVGRAPERVRDAEHWRDLAVMTLDREGADATDLRRARALHNLGLVHAERGDPARALELLDRALELRTAALGEDHPTVALLVETIGTLHADQGADDEALAHFERALALHEKALGIEHVALAPGIEDDAPAGAVGAASKDSSPTAASAIPEVGALLAEIGALYLDRHDPRALEALERARVIYEDALLPEDPRLGSVWNLLGRALRERGDDRGAARYFERARLSLGTSAGAADEDAIAALLELAELYLEQGRGEDALPLAEEIFTRVSSIDPSPALDAAASFTLARALWDDPARPERDRSRARALAERAHARLHGAGPRALELRGGIARWLAEPAHQLPAAPEGSEAPEPR